MPSYHFLPIHSWDSQRIVSTTLWTPQSTPTGFCPLYTPEISLRKGTNDTYAIQAHGHFSVPIILTLSWTRRTLETPRLQNTVGLCDTTLYGLSCNDLRPWEFILSWVLNVSFSQLRSYYCSLSFLSSCWLCPLPVFMFYISINSSQHMSIGKISLSEF